jgi:HSP20 family molecular chaperone IbpA
MDLVVLRAGGNWEPNADVLLDESSGELVVRVELAGADSESLRVFLDQRHLFICGRRTGAGRLHCGSFLQKEIPDGAFVKRLRLPTPVAQAEVTATYSDGMLTIALPIAATEYLPTARTEIRMIVKRILA